MNSLQESIQLDPVSLKVESALPRGARRAADDQGVVVSGCRGEAPQEVMRVVRGPRSGAQDTIVADQGRVLLFAGPSVALTVHVNVAQGVISDEASEAACRAVVDLAIVLVSG